MKKGNMMDMKSMMKRPETAEVAKESVEKARYPYGLELSLEDESLTKLGIDCADCEIGEKVIVHAIAEIISISQNSNQSDMGKNENRSLRLQIQKLNIKSEDDYGLAFDEAAGEED